MITPDCGLHTMHFQIGNSYLSGDIVAIHSELFVAKTDQPLIRYIVNHNYTCASNK